MSYVAPDLTERLERYDGKGDVFDKYRVDEQIAKALERKVWLPSGGSLVIDRTEAMTVVDVNTGKFTGSGGNLEQTVTKNNLEAAEEIVRQLRLRDIGGIIVIDFIDMVLENNRDLVLRRLVECLGRDRTRHQVAEVTSLGLVQMTRKRIGTGLVESFSVPCEHCHGRGVIIEAEPVKGRSDEPAPSGRTSSKRSSGRQRSAAKSEPETERLDPACGGAPQRCRGGHGGDRGGAPPRGSARPGPREHRDHDEPAEHAEHATEHERRPTPTGSADRPTPSRSRRDAPSCAARPKAAVKAPSAPRKAAAAKKARRRRRPRGEEGRGAKKAAAKKTTAKKARDQEGGQPRRRPTPRASRCSSRWGRRHDVHRLDGRCAGDLDGPGPGLLPARARA